MFFAACITNPGTDYANLQVVGRMYPTAAETRENFAAAWATFNSYSFGTYGKPPAKAYAIVQVVEGIDVAEQMTFKTVPLDAFKAQVEMPAKKTDTL